MFRFDRIAELMGVPAAPFVDTHKSDIHKMKVKLMNYMTALRTQKNHPDLPFGIGDDAERLKVVLQTTPNGYPILPIPMVSDNWRKQDWELLFTMYMGRHYRKHQHIHRTPPLPL